MRSTYTTGPLGLALLLALATPASAVINRTGQAFGRYGSGNTTIDQGSFPGGQLGPADTTGLFGAANANITVGAQGFIHEPVGVLAALSGFDAASAHPADPLNYFIASGGGATLVHSIDVTSNTLPLFTPVDIRFRLALAYDAGATHTFGTPGSASNNAISLTSVQANVTGLSNIFLSSNNNKRVLFTQDGTDTAVGLFAGTQETEFVIQSEVGGSITFALVVDADANGDVAGVPSPLLNHHAQAWSTVALAYGAQADNAADVQLSVTGPNAAFPTLAQVSTAHAAANLPANPYAPAQPLQGDLDNDGFVGITDLNIVLGNWNQFVDIGQAVLGDPSGDGFVGIEDLNTVLGNWNAGTPPTLLAATTPGVPEPATLSLLAAAAPALLRRR